MKKIKNNGSSLSLKKNTNAVVLDVGHQFVPDLPRGPHQNVDLPVLKQGGYGGPNLRRDGTTQLGNVQELLLLRLSLWQQ